MGGRSNGFVPDPMSPITPKQMPVIDFRMKYMLIFRQNASGVLPYVMSCVRRRRSSFVRPSQSEQIE